MRAVSAWRRLGASIAVVACATAIGCGSSSSDTAADAASAAPAATFTEIYAALFPLGTSAQCNYCHDRPANDKSDGNLAMGHTQADAYAALVGHVSTSSKCGNGKALVVPGDPDGSLLYQKMTATPGCGDRMPQGADPLTDAELAMVRSWIAAGAKND